MKKTPPGIKVSTSNRSTELARIRDGSHPAVRETSKLMASKGNRTGKAKARTGGGF